MRIRSVTGSVSLLLASTRVDGCRLALISLIRRHGRRCARDAPKIAAAAARCGPTTLVDARLRHRYADAPASSRMRRRSFSARSSANATGVASGSTNAARL